MSEDEVKQMLRDATDKDLEGTVWHVNTKHLMTFAQMVADKTRQEMSRPTKIIGPNLEAVLNSAGFYRKARITTLEEWEAHLSKEGQKRADEAAWFNARKACTAIKNAALKAAGKDSRAIATVYSNYVAACRDIDDRWDAAKAKGEST